MAKPAILAIKIITDASKAQAGLAKSGEDVSKWKKASVAAAAGAAAVMGIAVKFGKDAIAVAGAAAKANRILASTMGDAAGTQSQATKDAIAYADALANQTGISRGVIKSTQAILAAYSNLNPKMKGSADTFNRATKAAQDLAAAGFGDATGNAKMLGKALQDPIKYTKSLARMGVVFTKQEQDKINTMVKSGHANAAQVMILQKLEKQVGGTAAASASSSSKMKAQWEGVQEVLGTGLLPIMKVYNTVLLNIAKWMAANVGPTKAIIAAIVGLAAAVLVVTAAFKVYTAITRAVAAVTWLMNSAMLANPVVLIVVGVVALIAALVILYKKCAWFRGIVNATFAAMLTAVKAVWRFLSVTLAPVWDVLGKAVAFYGQIVKTQFAIIVSVLKTPLTIFQLMVTAVTAVVNAVKTLVDWLGKIKVPDIGGAVKKLLPWSHASAPAVSYSAPPATVRGRGSAAPATTSSGGKTYNVNIYGAVDPQSTARAVQRMLHRADVRGGRARFA